MAAGWTPRVRVRAIDARAADHATPKHNTRAKPDHTTRKATTSAETRDTPKDRGNHLSYLALRLGGTGFKCRAGNSADIRAAGAPLA